MTRIGGPPGSGRPTQTPPEAVAKGLATRLNGAVNAGHLTRAEADEMLKIEDVNVRIRTIRRFFRELADKG